MLKLRSKRAVGRPRLVALAALLLVAPGSAWAATAGEPVPHERSLGPATHLLRPGVQVGQAEEPQGRTVEEIRIVGNQRFDAEAILFFFATRVGQSFDWVMARQDYMTLFNTGWFENVVMTWEPSSGGGVTIIVEVVEKPVLRQVRIEGTSKVDSDDFLERMELLDRPVEIDDAVDEQELVEGIEVLTTMLQGEGGLQFVQVDFELADSEIGAGVDAVYSVIEGDEVRIAQVRFTGNTVFSERELRWALKRIGEHHFMSFLSKGDRFSLAGYEADMFGIMNMYLARGYLDFAWGDPEIEFFTDERELWWDDKRRMAITIPLQEGPQYRIGELAVDGNTHFTDQELLEALDLRPGDVVNVEQVRAAQDAIQGRYMSAGYLQIAVAPFPEQFPEERVANITYRVTEADVYRVNRIEFEGNSHTRDHVLRRNMLLRELQRWDQGRFQSSVTRLFQLGYFQDIRPDLQTAAAGEALDADTPADPQFGTVDVGLRVEEVGRNQISFGGGLSALEGGFIQFGYTTRNLFGYGQTLSLFGQFGSRTQQGRISFSDPYIFGKRIRFGADVFRDAIDFPDFQREGTGMSARFGLPLTERETLAAFIEYNYEVIDIGDVSSAFGGISTPLFQALFLTEGRRVTSSVRPFLLFNTIDNPFNPGRGQRSSLSYEIAGGPLGGSLDFYKLLGGTTMYIPLKTSGSGILRTPKQILAVNVQARYAEPRGDLTQLPIFERFFLGGSNSVRGTRLRSIGPIDERGNILGGTKALQYNLEYIFALTEALRVSVFHDAGQAWQENENISLTDMRRTAGLEFRVFAPVFNVPFRFFWAYNFDPLEIFGEERSTFEFAVGSTF